MILPVESKECSMSDFKDSFVEVMRAEFSSLSYSHKKELAIKKADVLRYGRGIPIYAFAFDQSARENFSLMISKNIPQRSQLMWNFTLLLEKETIKKFEQPS